jgi:hypothetical protein
MPNVSIFKDINSVGVPFNRSIDYVFERIRNGNSRKTIELIHKETDKERINLLKKTLPVILFTGTFSKREDASLIQHSGLICLDFDKYETLEDVKAFKDKLKANEYVYAAFLSPTYKGLKVIVKIPPTKETHRNYFATLGKYFDSPNFDNSCKNESRACYESYDPDIYINNKSLIFTELIDFEIKNAGVQNPLIRLKSESRIIQNTLTWWNKNYKADKGARNQNLFILAAAFNDFGVNEIEAENELLKFESSDFSKREIETIIRSAYSKKANFGTKQYEDNKAIEKINIKVRKGDTIKDISKAFAEHSIDEIESAVKKVKSNLAITEFWEYDNEGKLKIKPHKFKQFLEQNGFYKYYPNGSTNFIFVRVLENIVSDTSANYIKDFVLAYLYDSDFGIAPYDHMAASSKYFKDDYLSLLDVAKIDFKEDTIEKCYLYYKNWALEITKESFSKIDYLELNGYVWEKQIITRLIDKIENPECVFHKFLWLICGKDAHKLESFETVIGYMLHSYKTSSNNRAIIFNDEMISENPNGGSGKGIICNAIGKIKRICVLDGKQFNFEKSFPYQTVSADTQLLVFDDVKKNFNFESLFSLVTEGITLEKKNKDAIHLDVKNSPKILITTNYTIQGSGGSFERRKHEVEVSSYFSAKHTPLDEFKHLFFDEWSEKEWLNFDNYMIYCIQQFLSKGLQSHEYKNLGTRKFINETNHDFYEWTNEDGRFHANNRYDRRHTYEQFLLDYPDHKKWLTQTRFNRFMESFARFKGLLITTIQVNGVRNYELK